MVAWLLFVRTGLGIWWGALNGLARDGVLYSFSAIFALGLGMTSREAAQWHWGYLTAGPYLLCGLVGLVLSRLRLRRSSMVRVGLLGLVMLGSVAVPLGLEARWRIAQPEVSVINRSGERLANGQTPYPSYVKNGHLVNAVPGIPSYESFFPYFPLMGAFGLPSSDTHLGKGLTDPRIAMTLLTLLVGFLGLGLLRTSADKKIRVAQVLLALPTGALFLSTGGDDMPILALLLLGVVALQRRQNNLAGISLGLAGAMKLTAWPLVLGALLVARTSKDRAAWRHVAAWSIAILVATVVPFVIRSPWAFMSNVFEFPLGLAGVNSPAASPLPGHILTTLWSPLGHVLAPVTFVIGGYFATKYVQRSWPITLSKMLGLMSVSFAVMMCVASATRIGYLIYPLNFAVWSWASANKVVREPTLVSPAT